MAARVTQVVLEAIVPYPTLSPTTPTGAGVTKVALEAIVRSAAPQVLVTQVAVEAIVRGPADGAHGDLASSGGSETSHTFVG